MEHFSRLPIVGFLGGFEWVLIILWIGISYGIAKISDKGIIPFWIAFLVSIFITPIAGLIVALISLVIGKNKNAPVQIQDSLADRLVELNSLKEKGLLTDEEYKEQKSRILNSL